MSNLTRKARRWHYRRTNTAIVGGNDNDGTRRWVFALGGVWLQGSSCLARVFGSSARHLCGLSADGIRLSWAGPAPRLQRHRRRYGAAWCAAVRRRVESRVTTCSSQALSETAGALLVDVRRWGTAMVGAPLTTVTTEQRGHLSRLSQLFPRSLPMARESLTAEAIGQETL